MFTETPRQFDLYDFFSVFIPGATVLVGLYPFLPSNVAIGSLGLILPTIVLGFVVGRAIHNIGLKLDSRYDRSGHREMFASEITNPSIQPPEVIDAFYSRAVDYFDYLDLPDSRTDSPNRLLNSLYVAVRGVVHFDARGRSRTFQAVYSFFRSIEIAVLVIGAMYYGYGFLDAFGLNEIANYTSHFGTLGLPPSQFALLGLAIAGTAFFAFRRERWNYQELYIEYLIMDFLTILREE